MPANRILLVEDEPDLRQLVEHILLGEGYRADVAGTALKAASLLEMNSYDLVLTNAVLPDGNGIAGADKAKASGIKALIATGWALRIPKEDLERHDYVLKPRRPRELLDAVARQLEAAP